MADTPNLELPLWSEGQDLPNVTHNEALIIIDILLQGRIIDRDLTAPPGSPAEGDAYIVASVASGDWFGEEDSIAYFFGGIWRFITPTEGLQIFAADEVVRLTFLSGSWVIGGGPGSGQTLLFAVIDDTGSITLQTSATGASLSLAKFATGIDDLTFSGMGASTNVMVVITMNESVLSGSGRTTFMRNATALTVDTGRPTTAGARLNFVELEHGSCGGCPFMDAQGINADYTIEVKEIN